MQTGITVGGVNVHIGINIDNFAEGIKKAGVTVANFQKEIDKIDLEGVIKGDPFTATKKHLGKIKSEWNTIFNKLSDSMEKFGDRKSVV